DQSAALLISVFLCDILCSPAFTVIIFLFHDTATTEIYTLSLHDALPIYAGPAADGQAQGKGRTDRPRHRPRADADPGTHEPGLRSEEHTSELQSLTNLVCRLLLEKKKIDDTVFYHRLLAIRAMDLGNAPT